MSVNSDNDKESLCILIKKVIINNITIKMFFENRIKKTILFEMYSVK